MVASTDRDPSGGADDAVVAVRYGTLETTLGGAFFGFEAYGEADAPLRMDYYFWLVRRGGRTIVVDTGFDPRVGRARGRTCLIEPAAALAGLGVDPAAVEQVVITHLHYDHIGNLGLFPAAELIVDELELEFWTGPYGAKEQFARHNDPAGMEAVVAARERGAVTVVGPEHELAEGIVLQRLGGHTPGQQIVRLEAGGGEVVLASDTIHFYLELERDWPFAIHHDLEAMYRAYDTLRALGDGGATIVPGHDPAVMERFDSIGEFAVRLA